MLELICKSFWKQLILTYFLCFSHCCLIAMALSKHEVVSICAVENCTSCPSNEMIMFGNTVLKGVICNAMSKRSRNRFRSFERQLSACFQTSNLINESRLLRDGFDRFFVNFADLKFSFDIKSNFYFNIWTTDNKDTMLQVCRPIAFFTGICLFGNSLFGIDKNGNQVELVRLLTDGADEGTEGIADVIKGCRQHPSVIQSLKELRIFAELCKLIVSKRSVHNRIYVHVPTAEYLLAIFLYSENIFSKKAVLNYIKLLLDESSSMIQKIQLVSSDFVIFSPLQEWLDTFKECFINASSDEEKCYLFTKLAEQNIDNCIAEFLGYCSSEMRQIWENAVNCPEVKCKNLRGLASLSYVAAILLVKQRNLIGNHSTSNLWLCDVSYEMPIALQYKKTFQDIYGPLVCLHWLPLIFFHDPPRNSLFFLPFSKNHLISEHVI